MTTLRVLRRGHDAFELTKEAWAQTLALALRYGWNPPGPSTHYLADGFHVSATDSLGLSEAFDRIFDHALKDPIHFYPVQIDMGTLSSLHDFIQNGDFHVDSI